MCTQGWDNSSTDQDWFKLLWNQSSNQVRESRPCVSSDAKITSGPALQGKLLHSYIWAYASRAVLTAASTEGFTRSPSTTTCTKITSSHVNFICPRGFGLLKEFKANTFHTAGFMKTKTKACFLKSSCLL